MGITATKLDNRDVYEIDYSDVDEEIDGETVTAVFTNPADGDKSSRTAVNDGAFTVTVAAGYTGTDEVTITGSDGGEVSGSIVFG